MRITRVTTSAARHAAGALTEAFLIAALLGMTALAFSPVYAPARSLTHADAVFAAKGGHNAAATVACSVAPTTVSLGGMYTVSGGGFAPNTPLLVRVQDSHGSQYIPTSSDSTGGYAASSYSSWPGTSTVTVSDTSGQKAVVVAGCSFVVG